MDMYLAASERREQAQKDLTDVQSEQKTNMRSVKEQEEWLQSGQINEKKLQDAYETAAVLHPEEKTAADEFYEKQKNNAEISIQKAIWEVNKKLQDATNNMLEAMFRYNASHAGYVADKNEAGYHNHARQEFLKQINYQNPEIRRWLHFGDLDPAGFYILENLRSKTGIDFQSYVMNLDYLKKYQNDAKTLNDNDRTKAENLICAGKYPEILNYMLEHNEKLEQEIISWKEDACREFSGNAADN